jgi:hypothetical protein
MCNEYNLYALELLRKALVKTRTHQTRRFASRADIPKTYRELCELYLPRPIHDDAQDEEATAMLNALGASPGSTRSNKITSTC